MSSYNWTQSNMLIYSHKSTYYKAFVVIPLIATWWRHKTAIQTTQLSVLEIIPQFFAMDSILGVQVKTIVQDYGTHKSKYRSISSFIWQ